MKILANKNNLYALCQNGQEFQLKCFLMNARNEIVQTGYIDNIEQSNPSFIDDFEKANSVNANILISSDQKFIKIYHDDNDTTKIAI